MENDGKTGFGIQKLPERACWPFWSMYSRYRVYIDCKITNACFLLLVDPDEQLQQLRMLIADHHNKHYPNAQPLELDNFKLRAAGTSMDIMGDDYRYGQCVLVDILTRQGWRNC